MCNILGLSDVGVIQRFGQKASYYTGPLLAAFSSDETHQYIIYFFSVVPGSV
jgi:hypothetical protein